MGMFDHYEPDPAVVCPYCGTELGDWQGKDGPCLLLVWRQGLAAPLGQAMDEESQLPNSGLQQFRLPVEFWFRFGDAKCRFCPVHVVGHTQNQIWATTTVIVPSDAPYHEVVDLNENRAFSPHLWRRTE